MSIRPRTTFCNSIFWTPESLSPLETPFYLPQHELRVSPPLLDGSMSSLHACSGPPTFFTLPQAASSDVRNRKRMKESLTLGTGVLEALQNRIVTFHESLLCWGIWRSIEIEGPPQKKQICLSWGSLNQSQARPWPFCIHAQLPSRWHCNISQLLQRGKLHGKSSLPCLAFDGW